MTPQAQPDEHFIQLVKPEHERKRGQRQVLATRSDMAENIDSDGTDGEATDDVGLNGEAHGAAVTQSLQFIVRAATIE